MVVLVVVRTINSNNSTFCPHDDGGRAKNDSTRTVNNKQIDCTT